MSRSRASDPPLSLFAFQDIIMSVSGIIILIVLLLGLHIASSPGKRGELKGDQVFPDRSEKIAALRREAQQLRANLPELSLNEDAKPSSETPVQLPRKYRDLIVRRNRLVEETRKLEAARQRTAKQNGVAQQKVDKLVATIALIEQRLSEDSASLLLVPDRQTNATVFVVECSGARIRCGELNDSNRPASFRTGLDGKRKFVKYAVGEARGGNVCFVFMIKPSGIDYALSLAASLRQQNLVVGYDALEEDRSVFWR